MAFQLVYLSQQDPKWKTDILGFGDPGDTIGYVGCALTATAMLLSGHGYSETPKTLNQKLKNVNGFVSAAILWSAVNKIYPNVNLKAYIPCANSDAPLAQIDAAIAAGQPAIVQVDSSPVSGIQTHWVVLYQRQGDDYLMLDPWPYQPDTSKPDLLMKRYAQGMTLKRAISHVILYEAFGSGGSIPTPSTATTPQTQPTTTPASGAYARIKADVTWGLNLRSTMDTSSGANILTTLTAGTQLQLLESDGYSRVGAINQMLRVREPGGREGYVAAWYLERVVPATPPVETEPAQSPTNESPASPSTSASPTSADSSTSSTSTPTTSAPAPEPPKFQVIVKSNSTKIYSAATISAALVWTEKAGARLTVVEPAEGAKSKIGVAGKWVNVKATNGKRGFVEAEKVRLS